MRVVLKDARRLCQAPLRRPELVAYTCFMVSKWWWMSRANLGPKTNHTKGRWCTPATSQSTSLLQALAVSGERGPRGGACRAQQPHCWLHDRHEQNHGARSTPGYRSGSCKDTSTSDNTPIKIHATKDKDHVPAFALVHLVMKGTWTHGSGMP